MKSNTYLLVLFLLTPFVFSCNKDQDTSNLNSINGTWRWLESTGGIVGETQTPASSGKIINLQISNTQVKKYENGNLTSENSYTIQVLPSIFGGEKRIFVYNNGWKQSYEITGNQLKLNDECNDCYINKYVKEEN
jgi:hypothetical protein